ncbi:MAG TPA: diguanylate cyclase [Acidisarcina sp.]|nr:diguanylate cyclase [Acidisarcina sp.]
MSPENTTRPLILLADHNPESSSALTALLESWKYSVEVVCSGPEALARLNGANPPAVALLENRLPQLSGIEVVQEWHRHPHAMPVWTMILSDDASVEQVMVAKDAGVDDFLVKPVAAMELQVRLKTAERVHALHCELHQSIAAVRFQSAHDNVTGLWNREHMLGMLFQETDRVQRMQTPLCFMLLGIDGFPAVVQQYGMKGSDEILRQLVERFRRYLRSYDLIGRYGEGQFLIALPGCSSDDAVALGERLRRMIFRRTFTVGVEPVKLTGSFGIGHSKGRSPLVVLRETEHALSQAKLAGGDCVFRFGDAPPLAQPEQLPADAAEGSDVAPSSQTEGQPLR